MYIFDYCFHNSLLDCVYEELEIPLIIILMQILFDRTAVVFTTKSIQHFSHSQLVILTIYMLPSARRYFVSYQMIKFCTLKKSPAVQVTISQQSKYVRNLSITAKTHWLFQSWFQHYLKQAERCPNYSLLQMFQPVPEISAIVDTAIPSKLLTHNAKKEIPICKKYKGILYKVV